MKKPKLLTWKSTGQKAKVKLNNAIVELQRRSELVRQDDDGVPNST